MDTKLKDFEEKWEKEAFENLGRIKEDVDNRITTVSYTHLTLPTNREV